MATYLAMSNRSEILLAVTTAVAAVTSNISSLTRVSSDLLLLDDQEEKRKRIREEVDGLPFMKNKFYWRGVRRPLEYSDRFGKVCADVGRDSCRKLTHLYEWELLTLAELLNELCKQVTDCIGVVRLWAKWGSCRV